MSLSTYSPECLYVADTMHLSLPQVMRVCLLLRSGLSAYLSLLPTQSAYVSLSPALSVYLSFPPNLRCYLSLQLALSIYLSWPLTKAGGPWPSG